MRDDFRSLTNVAVLDVLFDCFSHPGPIVFVLDEFRSFSRSSVSGLKNVVVSSYKIGSYLLVVQNPYLSLVPEVFVFPLALS